MRTFLTSSNIAFVYSDSTEPSSSVTTDEMPTIGDLEEFVAFVKDERELRPMLVPPKNVVEPGRDWLTPLLEPPQAPLFLVNGCFLRVEQDETLARGTIVYVAPDGSRTTLLGTTADVDTHGIAWG